MRLLTYAPGGNGRGLMEAGFATAFKGQDASVYVVAAGETAQIDPALLAGLENRGFVVVLSSYREPWDSVADVILPVPTAFEKSGTTVSADGQVRNVVAAVKTRVPSLVATLDQLAEAIR